MILTNKHSSKNHQTKVFFQLFKPFHSSFSALVQSFLVPPDSPPNLLRSPRSFHILTMETINQNLKDKTTQVRFQAVGWRSLLQNRAGTSRLLILKSVVRGLCLERGMPIYSYIGENSEGRPVMVSYLDGNPRLQTKRGAQ